MVDVARLAFEADSRSVRTSTQDLDKMNAAAKGAGRSADQMANQSRRGFGQVRDGIRGVGDQAQSTERFVNRLRTAMLGIAGGLVIRNLMQTAMQMQRIRLTLGYVTGSAAAADAEFAKFSESADRLGVNILQSARAYTQFLAAAKTTGLSLVDARNTFEGVSAAMMVMGKDSHDVAGALLAFQQILSKGKVTAEELTQQLGERLPGSMAIAAEAMGMTQRELQDAMQKGELNAREFVAKMGAALQERFAPMIENMTDSSTKKLAELDNAFDRLKITIVNEGFMDAMIAALQLLTEIANNEHVISVVRGLGLAFKFLGENIEVVGIALGGLFALFAASNPIGAFITLLITGALWVIANWETVKTFFSDLFTVLEVWGREGADALIKAFRAAAVFVLNIWNSVLQWFRDAFREIQAFAIDFAISVNPLMSDEQRALIMTAVEQMQQRERDREIAETPRLAEPQYLNRGRSIEERQAFIRMGLTDATSNDARIAAYSQTPTGPDDTVQRQIEGFRALRELERAQAEAAANAADATGSGAGSKAIEKLADQLADLENQRDALNAKLAGDTRSLEAVQREIELRRELGEIGAEWARQLNDVAAQNERLTKQLELQESLADEQQDLLTTQAALQAQVAGDTRTLEMIEREIVLRRELGAEGVRWADRLNAITAENQALNDTLARQQAIADGVSSAFGTMFEDAIFGAKSFQESLAAVAQDLARLAYRQGALPLIGQGMGALFSNLLGGGAPDTGSSFVSPALASGAGFGAGAPGHATGFDGVVGGSGGTDSRLVQFWATPGERVQVTPQWRAGGDGGGVQVNTTINVDGGSRGADADQDMARRIGAEVEKVVEAKVITVIREQSRPGNMLNPAQMAM